MVCTAAVPPRAVFTPAPCAPEVDWKAPADPRGPEALAVFTVCVGVLIVELPQRWYMFVFCVVVAARPVWAL